MDILYVYHTLFNEDAAHANQIVHTCNALADRGHSVTVACAGNIEEYAEAHSIELRFNYRRLPVPVSGENTSKLVYYSFSTALASRKDLLFTRDISFLRFLSFIPSFLRPPVLYEAHKAYHVISEMTTAEECRRLDCANTVIAISQGVADDLDTCSRGVASVVSDAADVSQVPSKSRETLRDELDLDQDSTLFIYSGSFSEWKNDIKGMIKSIQLLSTQRSNVCLLIIGGTDQEIADLKKFSDSISIDNDTVRFLGYIPQHQVFRYLKAADVGIVPLKDTDAVASRYTSPLKLYEYLVSGLQVVASDVPAITTEFGDKGYIQLYNPGEIDSMTDSMQAALDRKPTTAEDINDFSYSTRAKRIESVINSMSQL